MNQFLAGSGIDLVEVGLPDARTAADMYMRFTEALPMEEINIRLCDRNLYFLG